MSSFAYFFVVFAFFIVSFGLGFYIIFNGHNAEFRNGAREKEVDNEGDTNPFAFPFLTVIKTSAMMIGELVRKQREFTIKYLIIILIFIKFYI